MLKNNVMRALYDDIKSYTWIKGHAETHVRHGLLKMMFVVAPLGHVLTLQ